MKRHTLIHLFRFRYGMQFTSITRTRPWRSPVLTAETVFADESNDPQPSPAQMATYATPIAVASATKETWIRSDVIFLPASSCGAGEVEARIQIETLHAIG